METEEGEEVPIIDNFSMEGEPCRDLKSVEECSAFEVTCGIFADLGYRYCRKTCGFCDSKVQRSEFEDKIVIDTNVGCRQLSTGGQWPYRRACSNS